MTSADAVAGVALERVMVDTNVLLAATDTTRDLHHAAVTFLNEDPRVLAVSPQIIREYLAVATRPTDANGLGLDGAAAATNVVELLHGMEIVDEDADSADRLAAVVASGSVAGKQVHDANVVAVALEGGAHIVVTDDCRHFARFDGVVTIEELRQRG